MRRDEINIAKVRTGLAVVTVAFIVALVVAFVVDDATARLIMGLVMFSALVRAALLVRTLRR